MSPMDVISDNANKNLKKVPENIMQMVNLKMLYLEENQIEELPTDFFEKLNKLTWLDLRKNKLTTIPSNVGDHQCLETILLQNNQIEYLPLQLGIVPKLKVLQISGNPLVFPSKDILNQGTSFVCSYLKTEYARLTKEKSEEEIVTIDSPDSCSVVTKDVDQQNVILPPPAERDANSFVPIVVKSLSEGGDVKQIKPVSSSHFKRTHKITRGCSKISLRSHSSWTNRKKNEKNERIQEHVLKDIWLRRLTDLLADQEKILQQEKNLKALGKWRLKKKFEPDRKFSLTDLPQPPYDTDPEFNQMLSRKDLTEQVDTIIGRSRQKKKKGESKKVNIQELIDEVVNQMKYLQSEVNRRSTKSPRTELNIAGKEIESIIKLHKKIVDLQQKNNTF